MKVVLHKNKYNLRYDETKKGFERCTARHFIIPCTVLEQINATISVKLSNQIGGIDDDSRPDGTIRDILFNVVDVNFIHVYLRDYWKVQAYPFLSGAIKIISLRTPKDYTKNFFTAFTIQLLFLYIATCFGCIIALKYITKQPLSSAALNFIRLSLNLPLEIIATGSAVRIFLVILSIAAFDINSCIQSLLSTMQTAPNMESPIDTLEDLIESDLTIVGSAGLKGMLWQDDIRNRYRISIISRCLDMILMGDRVACLGLESYLGYYLPGNASIHKSRNNVLERSSTYTLANDSPLLGTFSWVLSKMSEGGLIELFYAREQRYINSNIHHDKTSMNPVKPLDIDYFFNYFLIIVGS